MEDVTNQKIVDLLVEIRDLLQKQPVHAQGNAGEVLSRRYQNDDDKWVYELPKVKESRKCKYCGDEIYWVKYKNKKQEISNIPCNEDGECHYETCSDKEENRKPFVPVPQDTIEQLEREEEKIPF